MMKDINEKIDNELSKVSLTLDEQEKQRTYINEFFESLDETHKSRLMGILLGTGAVKKKDDGSFEVIDKEKADAIANNLKNK